MDINKFFNEKSINFSENVTKWAIDNERESKEKLLKCMKDFLTLEKEYLPVSVMFDRIVNTKYKSQDFSDEDKHYSENLKIRQKKIKNIVDEIEKTGKWPVTIDEVYEIINLEIK